MNCPICSSGNIPDGSMSCSVCRTDLSPIQRIRGLYLIYYNNAIKYIEAGNFEEALSSLTVSQALNPVSHEVHSLMGKVYWKLKRKAKALNEFKTALKICPENEKNILLVEAASRGGKGKNKARKI